MCGNRICSHVEGVFSPGIPESRHPIKDLDEGESLAAGKLDEGRIMYDQQGVEIAGKVDEHLLRCSVQQVVLGGCVGTMVDVHQFCCLVGSAGC